MPAFPVVALAFILIGGTISAAAQEPLPGTKPLTAEGDLAAQMVEGIRKFYVHETEKAALARNEKWKRDFSSGKTYARSVDSNREHLAEMIGATRARLEGRSGSSQTPELVRQEWTLSDHPVIISPKPKCQMMSIRWPVFTGVEGEGIVLTPAHGRPVANIILLLDCDELPEEQVWGGLQPSIALRLVEHGCRVFIPVLIDRNDRWSGHPNVKYTNQPHREFLWRAAYEVGRTPIGLEVDKVLALADNASLDELPLGVFGYGEGGLIALYASALDQRFKATVVSGYFAPREKLWSEPIYRNVFGLLSEFGDAEIASLIAPRALVIEASKHPEIAGPPAPHDGRSGAAPGSIATPPIEEVRAEFQRAAKITDRLTPKPTLDLVEQKDGRADSRTLSMFLSALTARSMTVQQVQPRVVKGSHEWSGANPMEQRAKRQFEQLMDYTQRLMRESQYRRAEFWKKADASSPERWAETTKQYRDIFWDQIIGRLPAPAMPINAHSRLVYDEPKYRGYEVTLDVYPYGAATPSSQTSTLYSQGIFAYGILLIPKDLKPGEQRPIVVCQHGLEGRPQDVADPKINNPAYNQFACRLAEQGFITYAPQNPYIGGDNFRVLLRMAQPLGRTLFSVIARQHERTLDWLASLPFVDPARMAFYGLSYGGKTAMRMPAILERYCLSICSADYNEWIWKCMDTRSPYSYLFTNEYDMPEWNLANTFNYAEMSWLICPRPFMVERGHLDGVAPDQWIGYEYARTRQRYDLMGIGDRTELEVFNGPHTIHGVGTFAFLKKHLHFDGGQ